MACSIINSAKDISYPKTLNWLASGVRWMRLDLPVRLVKDGAISHARVKLGVAVFRDIFYKFVLSFTSINPDFHGWVTVVFDGTSMTMPDTESNRDKWGFKEAGIMDPTRYYQSRKPFQAEYRRILNKRKLWLF